MSSPYPGPDAVLGLSEIKRLTGKSTMTIWRWERKGRFPRRIRLGENSVGWLRSEFEAWLAARVAERNLPVQRLGRSRRRCAA
jgi:prophage regulatory protein